jgi:hypothetical protein
MRKVKTRSKVRNEDSENEESKSSGESENSEIVKTREYYVQWVKQKLSECCQESGNSGNKE